MQSSWYSYAKSDYTLFKNRTAHSRGLRSVFLCVGTIPQSAKLTAPFTQRGLWCGGILILLCKEGNGLPYPKGISYGHTSDIGHWFAMTR